MHAEICVSKQVRSQIKVVPLPAKPCQYVTIFNTEPSVIQILLRCFEVQRYFWGTPSCPKFWQGLRRDYRGEKKRKNEVHLGPEICGKLLTKAQEKLRQVLWVGPRARKRGWWGVVVGREALLLLI